MDTTYIEQTTGFSSQTVGAVIDGFIKFIQLELQAGNEVKVNELGVFYPKEFGERKSRNPRTGESVMAKPRTKPRIRFFDSFEKMIQDNPDTPSQVNLSDLIPPAPVPPVPPAPPVPPVPKIWYIVEAGKPIALTEPELKGRISPTTQIWSQETDWKLVSEIPELKYLLS